MARKSTTPPVQPILPSNEPSPAVTFSPEKLAELLNMLSDQKAELAAIKASMVEANKAKMAKPAPVAVTGSKTDKAIANEMATIKAFKKAGFQNVIPHQNVLTFNKWMAQGRRPIEGSKSLKINNLRLFHVTQTREITSEEKAANVEQQAAAVARHDKAPKTAKTAKVVPINANPQ